MTYSRKMGTLRSTALILFLSISSTFSSPLSPITPPTSTQSLVISTSTQSTSTQQVDGDKEQNTPNKQDESSTPAQVPKISEMRIDCNITNRFAKTAVTSRVKNLGSQAQEARFAVVLPETAYITGFVMEIGGKSYAAYVKEKEEAKQIYDSAISAGLGAGHVEASARDSNRFSVSLNVEPQSKATFRLTYEELLQRHDDQYELVINIHPGQPVKNLEVEVHINETRPLKFVRTPAIRSGNEITKNDDAKAVPSTEITNIDPSTAVVKFSPDVEKQKQFANTLGTKEEDGLSGQFVVQYEVERDPHGGEVLLKDGYFVHFFSASDSAQPLPKHVVFVLDTSGSMMGVRIRQLKEAMQSILGELKPEDYFNVVDFDSSVRAWNVANRSVAYTDQVDNQYNYGYYNPYQDSTTSTTTTAKPEVKTLPPAYQANEKNVQDGIGVVKGLDAAGGTNIMPALETGLKIANEFQETHKNTHQPLIVFLTDGEATVGETDPLKICAGISEKNLRKTPIFSLSLGEGADRSLLQKLSLQNYGFSRRIYEAADTSLQLQEFYKDISSPLLNNVKFQYVTNATNVTKTDFPLVFKGAELVVAGVLDENAEFAPPQVEANGVAGPMHFKPTKIDRPVGDLERLWAYLTVKQILEAREATDNKKPYEEKALALALKYSFVTPVSSLVVVKPNNTEDNVKPEDASRVDGNEQGTFVKQYSMAAIGPHAPQFLSGLPGPFLPVSKVASRIPSNTNYYSQRMDNYGGASSAFAVAYDVDHDVHDLGAPVSLSTTVPYPQPPPISRTAIDQPPILDLLPWLRDVLSEDNSTIALSSGNYTLGLNATSVPLAECPSAVGTNSTGSCTYLQLCPQVFGLLSDVATYEKYFCSVKEFAGVCCPDQPKSSTTPAIP